MARFAVVTGFGGTQKNDVSASETALSVLHDLYPEPRFEVSGGINYAEVVNSEIDKTEVLATVTIVTE